jgi:DNA-binding MarR family transcriptional regulator
MTSPRGDASPAECAAWLVEVAPSVVRVLRMRMRAAMPPLTMSQFRALMFLDGHRGCTVTALATHLGTTLPTASVLVDRLVRRGWVVRTTPTANRRETRLSLTRRGTAIVEAARDTARRQVAQILRRLPRDTRAALRRGLVALHEAFAGGAPARAPASLRTPRVRGGGHAR